MQQSINNAAAVGSEYASFSSVRNDYERGDIALGDVKKQNNVNADYGVLPVNDGYYVAMAVMVMEFTTVIKMKSTVTLMRLCVQIITPHKKKKHHTKFDYFCFETCRAAVGVVGVQLLLSCCVRCLCCCEKDKRCWWRVRTKKNNGRSVGACVVVFLDRLESLRNFDDRRSTITLLASWRLCSSEPKRRRCRALARARR